MWLGLFRQLVAWHRPFCVDLEESTFTYLCNFLKCYCDGLEDDTPPTPFLSKRCVITWTLHCFRLNCVKCITCSPFLTELMLIVVSLRDHHQFILLCMKLLSVHLSLAHAGGTGAMVLGTQGRPLRNLLFRLIDTNMPDSIQQVNSVLFRNILLVCENIYSIIYLFLHFRLFWTHCPSVHLCCCLRLRKEQNFSCPSFLGVLRAWMSSLKDKYVGASIFRYCHLWICVVCHHQSGICLCVSLIEWRPLEHTFITPENRQVLIVTLV